MGLFSPAWRSKNMDEALRAVAKITSDRKLLMIANDGNTTDKIRAAAIRKIKNQSFLLGIVKKYGKDAYSFPAQTAAETMTSQSMLLEIVNQKDAYSDSVRVRAATALTDRKFAREAYERIFTDTLEWEAFNYALEHMKSEQGLTDKDLEQRLCSHRILKYDRIYLGYVDKTVITILDKITDPEVIEAVLSTMIRVNKDGNVRLAATKQLYNLSGKCPHWFEYGPASHVGGTAVTISEGVCKVCGKTTTLEGLDDNW